MDIKPSATRNFAGCDNIKILDSATWRKDRLEKINTYLASEKRQDFIDDAYIESVIAKPSVYDRAVIDEIIEKATALKGLSPEEAAYLLNLKEPGVWENLGKAAMAVKQKVYGNRIVLFAPLYLSSRCVNNCVYCGFRETNEAITRKRLEKNEIEAEIKAMTAAGHKRIIAVYGEHPESDINYYADSVRTIYAVKNGPDKIMRVNVNAAPLFVEEYKIMKEVGIGTYQVFMETYHKETYRKMHPAVTIKGSYYWRLFAQHRAQEAGINDVAIGALIGLYDYRFEVLAMIMHSASMDKEFGAGSHTISFPRLEPASNTPFIKQAKHAVTDEDMKKIITVLRMAVPYTGLILTAREGGELRRELIKLGVTQTDAGSNIAIGGYAAAKENVNKQQFELQDKRTLDNYISELIDDGYIPSFCTADYRCGRTGCEFMEFAKSGKIKNFCIPNAILTFKEYLIDYASPAVKVKGEKMIQDYLKFVRENYSPGMAGKTQQYIDRILKGERDLYF